MKWSFKHKSRKAFLTAAICLALSQSVFAMPTGGKVVDGTVTGILDNGTVANGTINVNSNALIDWTAFNIAKGETLNFKFGQDYLNVINHVTGSEMSQLLGTLNAKNGNVYLINPNGILVGGGARIDAGSLVLSTLDTTDDQLISLIHNNAPADFDLENESGNAGITIKNGADIQFASFLGLLGNKVQIADNVTISDASSDTGETTMVVAAADKATLSWSSEGANDIGSVMTTKDNTVDIGKADFNISGEFSDSYFLGNAISMTGTNLNIKSKDQGDSSTALDIVAADSYNVTDDDNVNLAMNPANRLDLDHVYASADYMNVMGGKTSINQSELVLTPTTDEVKQDDTMMPYMKVAALNGKNIVSSDAMDVVENTDNTDGTTLTIKDSKLTSNENIALWGGSIELTNTNLKTDKETNDKDNNIDIDAFKTFGDTTTADSSNTVKVTGGSMESGGDISVQGGSIALDGVKNMQSAKEKGISLVASNKLTVTDKQKDEIALENTADNSISVKNTTMTTDDAMAIIGGKVDVDGSNLTAGDLEMVAGSSYKDDGNTLAGTDATNLSISGSTLHSNEDLTLVGSNINLDNTKVEVGTPTDKTYGSNGVVRIAAAKNVTLYDEDGKGFGIESANNTGNLSLNNVTMNALGEVDAYGKTIDIQDSKLTGNNLIAFQAGNSIGDDVNSTADNTINLSNTTVDTNDAGLALIGGKVNVTDGSNLSAGDLEITAGSAYTDNGDTIKGTDATNISVNDSTIHANRDVKLTGSNIDLTKTKIDAGTADAANNVGNGVVRMVAGKNVTLVTKDENGHSEGEKDFNEKNSVVFLKEVSNTGNLKMDGVTVTAQGNVTAYGKNITVKASDLKTQNASDKENDLSLNALNHYESKDGSDDTWEAAKDNTLTVTDSKLTNNDMVELVGGNVSLDKAEITARDASVAARSGYKSVKVDENNDTVAIRHDAVDGMNVSIKDSKITSQSGLGITGHDVTIDGKTNLSAKDFLAVGTGSIVTTDFENNTVAANGKTVKVSKDTTFESDHKVIVPGIEVIDNTKPSDPGTKPSDPSTKPSDPGTKPSDPGTQPSDPGTQPTDPGTKPSDPGTKPTEPDQPSKPDKPVVTPDPKPAVDVEKNIEQGKQDMTKALADNQDNASAAVKQQAEKLSDSKMTDEEKAAQVKGYAEAIENSQASAEEKQALVKDTVKSFEPTQQSSLEAQNKQDEAAQNNNAQTVIPDVTVKNVAPAEHEGAAATVTVDGTVVSE